MRMWNGGWEKNNIADEKSPSHKVYGFLGSRLTFGFWILEAWEQELVQVFLLHLPSPRLFTARLTRFSTIPPLPLSVLSGPGNSCSKHS